MNRNVLIQLCLGLANGFCFVRSGTGFTLGAMLCCLGVACLLWKEVES